jgi:glyoxylase-like metal-dependent hydrolase (beta-lactamase superfamily II)
MVPVPIPVNPLRYVLVYAFEASDGLVLVDSGWDTPEAWDGLNDGLATFGAAIGDVRGVLVTHIHPDHYGLAGRLRSETGCWVGLHPADAALIDSRYVDVDDLIQRTRDSMLEGGVPPDAVEELATASLRVREFVSMADPDVDIEDGDRPPVPGWDLVAVHTPGHTPGHLCFALPAHDAVLTGDHVLPRITPNVSFHAQSGSDPLGDFLGSLDRLRMYGDATGLPGHEWPFSNLSSRIDELVAHHDERLSEAERLLSEGAETAWGVAEAIGWSRSWQRLEPFMRRMAVAEIHAHLILLERRGRITRIGERPSRWQPA